MNTLLMVGGELCNRVANALSQDSWKVIGIRRTPISKELAGPTTWYQADLSSPQSLSFLGEKTFASVSHVLYAPSPDSRSSAHYESVYPQGLGTLLSKLPAGCIERLQRCILVGSSAVWAPSDAWVDEDTPATAANFRARAVLQAEETLHTHVPLGAVVALRLSGLYGPGRTYLLNALRAGIIPAHGGPGHWSNRIHIDDAASACAHLLTIPSPKPLYIGTDNCPLPTSTLYDSVAELLGAPTPARNFCDPTGKRLSNSRLRASGWTPTWGSALDWYTSTLCQSTS